MALVPDPFTLWVAVENADKATFCAFVPEDGPEKTGGLFVAQRQTEVRVLSPLRMAHREALSHGPEERVGGVREAPSVDTLYRQHYLPMLRVAHRVTRDWGAAEDAVQEAMFKAARGLSGFCGRSSLSTWLYRITINEAITVLRREQRERRVMASLIQKDRPHEASPGDVLDQVERRAQVRALMASLKQDHRSILLLRYHKERTDAEIAQQMGLPPGTVKSRLHRARLAFAQLVRRHPADAVM